MSDLISRRAVIEEVHNFVEAHRNDDDISWTGLDWLLKEDDIVAMINNIPAAAQEKQISYKPEPCHPYEGKCKCGAMFLDRATEYCGNCGQKLDWSEDNE